MKKNVKIFITLFFILVLVICIIQIYKRAGYYTMKLVVVNAEGKRLETMDYNEKMYSVSIKDGDTSDFKKGQEVLIYYDGIVATTYPGQITADKVEILKEKSNKEIPVEVLRYWSFSPKNISAKVEEISNTGINFKITDLNEIPLDYGKAYEYSIVKKNVENEEYNQNLEFDYNAYTPPVTTDTYSTTSSYRPDSNRLKKVWEEPELMGNEEDKICNWDSILDDGKIFVGKCNWINLYGKLESGEYEFKAYRTPEKVDDFFQCIIVKFIIDENGNITYEESEFSF